MEIKRNEEGKEPGSALLAPRGGWEGAFRPPFRKWGGFCKFASKLCSKRRLWSKSSAFCWAPAKVSGVPLLSLLRAGGFWGQPPPSMASSCLGWGQLRTAVLSPLGALLRGDRWLKALGIQQSGGKWEKMGAEGGGQAPAGLSPSPLQEADAPDQWENLRKGPKPLWGGERGGLSSPLPSPSTDKPSPEPQIGAALNHCFRNEQVPLGFTFPIGDR